jgi:hypothetical protein
MVTVKLQHRCEECSLDSENVSTTARETVMNVIHRWLIYSPHRCHALTKTFQ